MATESPNLARWGAGIGTREVYTASTAVSSAKGVDTLGYDMATAFFQLGNVTGVASSTLTITVEESADNTSFAAITGATSGAVDMASSSTKDYAVWVFTINLKNSNRLRYLRIATTPSAHAVNPGITGGGIVCTNGGNGYVADSTTSGANYTKIAIVL